MCECCVYLIVTETKKITSKTVIVTGEMVFYLFVYPVTCGKVVVTIPNSQEKLLREVYVCNSRLGMFLQTVSSKILALFHSNMFRSTNDKGTDGRQNIRQSPPMLSAKNNRKT